MNEQFSEPGHKVRLKSDPSKLAITTGKIKTAGPFTLVQIEFGPNERPFKRAEQLELVSENPEEPELLLAQRKWSGPEALRRALAVEKIRGQLTDVFYSMETSRTDFFPHQFKPVMKFVESPTGRLLIADEVGLGKTIEAIYLWREVEAREHARRLLIVCPSMLREKWRADMDRLFGLEAEIVDAKSLNEKLKKAKAAPDRTSFALIASFEAARPPRDYLEDNVSGPRAEIARLLHEVSAEGEDPLLDLVVVDEAHYLRNANTLTHRLGVLLGEAARHMALLTATPIQIGSENLFNLMRLLDQDVFEDVHQFDSLLAANAPIVEAQRLVWSHPPDPKAAAAALAKAMGSDYFEADPTLPAMVNELNETNDLSPSRRVEIGRKLEASSLIAPYMTRSRKREVIEKRVERTAQVLSVDFKEEERQTYQRISDNLRGRSVGMKGVSIFALIARQRQMASSLPAALQAWNDKGVLEDLAWEDFGRDMGDLSDLGSELPAIDLSLARRLEELDSKYEKLKGFLRDLIIENPDEKIIIFAFFRGTLAYLHRRLETDGFDTALIMGGGSRSKTERSEILKRFADPKGPSILLSSEVGSEGIDLQFCRIVVNYDLPWNPMRVEQRIGRIDRLGQKAERISIVNFAVVDTVEDRILMRLYDRIALFQETIGDLEGILGEISDALLERIFDPNLTDEEREQIAHQSELAIENARQEQENLESQAVNLIGFSDYLMDTIREARELGRWLSPDETISFVEDFFKRFYPGTRLEPVPDSRNALGVTLSDEARHALAAFSERRRMSRRSRLTSSNNGVRCFFDPRRTEALPVDGELVDTMHPLLRWIEAEISSHEGDLVPSIGISIATDDFDGRKGLYAFASQKWELRGIRSEIILSHRAICVETGEVLDSLHAEKLVIAASRNGSKIPFARLDDAELAAGLDTLANCTERLNEEFGNRVEDFELENMRRCAQQRTSAQRLADRKIGELAARAERMESEGKSRGARLARDQIKKQQAILSDKMARIGRRSDLDVGLAEVATGLIRIEAGGALVE
ncbi:SNF2-related protein [Ruegeria faecimaris]|uniref:SNF2-related protein n=1 Tax=Ruegeria faecimaris TaxID=686389 RepID=UPI002492AEDC|nr:SNF2-related protein [Ruegeria faecimaris]